MPNIAGTGGRGTVQRACNGCARLLGDITVAETDAAVSGAPIPDVRDECPACTPNPPRMSWFLELPITAPRTMDERFTSALRTAVRALARTSKIPPLCALCAELHYTPRRELAGPVPHLAETLAVCEGGLVDANLVPDGSPLHVLSATPVIDPPSGERQDHMYLIVRELQPGLDGRPEQ